MQSPNYQDSAFAQGLAQQTKSRLYTNQLINNVLVATGIPLLSNQIDASVNEYFSQAANLAVRYDPLILDLDGDGIETIAADGQVLFDHDGDGIKHATGWVGVDDALLVYDINQNGQIENGSELFGDNTLKVNGDKASDGFEALRDLDSNKDGVFDKSDESFTKLKLWQDQNSDGVTQAAELKSLAELGVSAINLSAYTSNKEVNGGAIAKASYYINEPGEQKEIGALDFNANLFYRVYEDGFDYEFSEELERYDLAFNLKGSGAVRDLNQAVALNPDIADIVEQITASRHSKDSQNLYHRVGCDLH